MKLELWAKSALEGPMTGLHFNEGYSWVDSSSQVRLSQSKGRDHGE